MSENNENRESDGCNLSSTMNTTLLSEEFSTPNRNLPFVKPVIKERPLKALPSGYDHINYASETPIHEQIAVLESNAYSDGVDKSRYPQLLLKYSSRTPKARLYILQLIEEGKTWSAIKNLICVYYLKFRSVEGDTRQKFLEVTKDVPSKETISQFLTRFLLCYELLEENDKNNEISRQMANNRIIEVLPNHIVNTLYILTGLVGRLNLEKLDTKLLINTCLSLRYSDNDGVVKTTHAGKKYCVKCKKDTHNTRDCTRGASNSSRKDLSKHAQFSQHHHCQNVSAIGDDCENLNDDIGHRKKMRVHDTYLQLRIDTCSMKNFMVEEEAERIVKTHPNYAISNNKRTLDVYNKQLLISDRNVVLKVTDKGNEYDVLFNIVKDGHGTIIGRTTAKEMEDTGEHDGTLEAFVKQLRVLRSPYVTEKKITDLANMVSCGWREDLRRTITDVNCKINLKKNAKPFYQNYRINDPIKKRALQNWGEISLKAGIIAVVKDITHPEWCHVPVIVNKKKVCPEDATPEEKSDVKYWRITGNFVGLNAQTERKNYLLPKETQINLSLRDKESRELTRFYIPDGRLCEYTVMPQGITDGSFVNQEVMDRHFHDVDGIETYI
eukprot:Awhi_evm1s6036